MEGKEIILNQKIAALVEDLMRSEPPFDEIHKYPSMHTSYGRYTELYEILSIAERKRLIEVIRNLVGNFIRGSIFRLEDLSDDSNQLMFSYREVIDKYDEVVSCKIGPREGKDELVKVVSLLKSQIPVRLPQFKLTKFAPQPQLTSFSKNLFGETNLIFAFDKGSFGGNFTMFIGVTKPERFLEIGDLFGCGGFSASVHNLKEFQKGFEEACKVIEFLTPKLERFFFETPEEFLTVHKRRDKKF